MNKENNNNNNITVVLILSVIISFISGVLGSYLVINTQSVESVVKNITTSELIENGISSSVEKVYDSVVAIIAYKDGKQISSGTGFVYKKDNSKGYIMTNNHVIEGCDEVEVILSNNEKVEAKVQGGELYSDVAVLTMDVKHVISVVEFGDNSKMKLGDTVFTVGSPLGVEYSGTVTKGVLSGKDRLVEVSYSGTTADYYVKVLQTDAAINPGNSGGPLFDVSGKVIGITSLKLVQDEVEGMGFAIPIEDAINYASTLELGKLARPYFGISMMDITESYYLYQYKVVVPENVKEGVAVIEVAEDSPAEKAGIKKGDIVLSLGKEKTETLAKFRYELYKHKPGEEVEVVVNREGKEQKIKVTLEENK